MADAILTNFSTGRTPEYITAQCTFDAETFKTDPTGCLAYTNKSDFQIPVLNTSTTLGKAEQEGDWAFDMTTSDIDKKGTNLFGMYYCTFDESGKRQYKLNPYNLTQIIARWNDAYKRWVSSSGTSPIDTNNTMLMIPTLYWKGEANRITLSQDPSKGTPYAHKIDNKVYNWLAIGVYISYNNSDKAMSLSGKTFTSSLTRAKWRTYSSANTVDGGKAIQWNFHQYQLMRFLAYMSCKSFQTQGKIGMGGNPKSTGVTGGCNTLGPYAGDISGTSSSCKCLIEDFWGFSDQFIDDVLVNYGPPGIYIGQSSSPTDTLTSKTKVSWVSGSGYPATIITSDLGWGLGKDSTGSSSKGLCDHQYFAPSSPPSYLLTIGGGDTDVSSGSAGAGCLNYFSLSSTNKGSRLSFVLD